MGKKLLLLVCMYSGLVFAGGPDNSSVTTNNYYNNASSPSNKTGGAALSLSAAQCKHDWGASSLQGCVGLSDIDGNVGKAFGLGYRTGDILINGVIAEEDGLVGVGAGLNFHFK